MESWVVHDMGASRWLTIHNSLNSVDKEEPFGYCKYRLLGSYALHYSRPTILKTKITIAFLIDNDAIQENTYDSQ